MKLSLLYEDGHWEKVLGCPYLDPLCDKPKRPKKRKGKTKTAKRNLSFRVDQ